MKVASLAERRRVIRAVQIGEAAKHQVMPKLHRFTHGDTILQAGG